MTDYFSYADFVDAFIASMELYCGREYVDHFPFRVASLLDPRVFKYEGNSLYLVEGFKDSDSKKQNLLGITWSMSDMVNQPYQHSLVKQMQGMS